MPVFGVEFAGARRLLVVLAFAEVCFAPFTVTSRGLLGGGWTRTACLFGIGGSVAALVVYIIAAGVGGSMGVAVRSVIMYGSLSAISWHLLKAHLVRAESPPLASTTSKGTQS